MTLTSDLMNYHSGVPIFDLSRAYSRFVPFTVNAAYPVHRWYRFKEGFSRDFVHVLLGSQGKDAKDCLDPFGGSGTTPLTCQEIGVRCHSIEVNPFLHHIMSVKLNTSYTVNGFDATLGKLRRLLRDYDGTVFEEPIMSTLTRRPNLKKWLFSRAVLQGILTLQHCFSEVDPLYARLFLLALASILTDVGNTDKDGKCVRYKQGWRDHKFGRKTVYSRFFERIKIFRDDVDWIEKRAVHSCSNAPFSTCGSVIDELNHYAAKSFDLVITSPPYLNSWDYTDVYMPELWALGFVRSYEDVRDLRARTLRSHVQVRWEVDTGALREDLRSLISKVARSKGSLWNTTIPKMIGGYFLDMQDVFSQLRRVLRPGGKICLAVGTSSYKNIVIPTDLLLARSAEEAGFELTQMNIVRGLTRSTQQSAIGGRKLPALRESVLFLSRK